MILQLVAAKRGISVLPDWLVREEGAHLPIRAIRLGRNGIKKSINLGVRPGEEGIACISGIMAPAQKIGVESA